MNIISNAIKYTAQIDNAEIAIYSEQTDKGSINVSSTEGKGTLVRLFFLDKGNTKK